jgi:PEP-CTERM motif
MRRLFGFSCGLVLLLAAVTANAAPFAGSLTFVGLTDGEAVGNFYQSEGITFTGFYAVAGDYYTCQGTQVTCSASVNYGAIMDVQPGFLNGLSFYFKNGASGDVLLYDGLDGQGTRLGDVSLWPATNEWEPFGFMFPGLAQSAVFDLNNAEVAVLTMGGAMVIPEPATALLFLSGLGVLARLRRRR